MQMTELLTLSIEEQPNTFKNWVTLYPAKSCIEENEPGNIGSCTAQGNPSFVHVNVHGGK